MIHVGTVRWFDDEKRRGVIELDHGGDLVLVSKPETPDGFRTLTVGEPVEIKVETRECLHATSVRRVLDSAQL